MILYPAEDGRRVADAVDAVLAHAPGIQSAATQPLDLPYAAPSPPTESLPTEFGGRYTPLRRLGRGGMATVYLARDTKHDRPVAVKVLNSELTARVGAQRFVQEIRLTARLQHPHVLALLDSGVFGDDAGALAGRPYYVMPYVEGESLRARLEAHDAPSLAEALRVLRDVADALSYAHAQGVVHRDIKPENILLSGEHAVIADFGIAKALFASQKDAAPGAIGDGETPALTRLTTLVGTPAYMAPEQADATITVDRRADIYAWGVVAYELLAGRHPFAESANAREFVVAHVSEMPPPLRRSAPTLPALIAAFVNRRASAARQQQSSGIVAGEVPSSLVRLVMSCLEKDPASRPQEASELIDVLDDATASLLARRRPRALRSRSVGVASTVLVTALIATGALAWRVRAARSAPPLVAVLPFETEGASPDSSFAKGLGDAIAGKLARLGGLRVIDSRSVRSVPNAAAHPQQTGKLLGAEYVLRASVRWMRSVGGAVSIQVSPSLVRVADGTTAWVGEPEVVPPGDPFAVQSTIATHVAETLGVPLGSAERARLARVGARDSAAAAAVDRGLRIWGRSTDRPKFAMEQALREFERAYRVDPKYADAFAEAAALLVDLARTGESLALYDSAAVLARRAVALDPGQFRAVNVLSTVELAHDRPTAALPVIERAVRENPSSAELLALLGHTRQLFGDSAAAWDAVSRALPLGPRSEPILTNAFDVALALHRYSDARILLARRRALDPGDLGMIRASGWLAAAVGDSMGVALALREFRSRGGVLRAGPMLFLVRHADESLQQELATASPDTYSAASAADSVAFFTEKAKLFMTRRDAARARRLMDSAFVIDSGLVSSPTSTPEWRRQRWRELAWLAAARGDRAAALAALQRGATSPRITLQPGSTIDAEQTCATAEVFALLHEFEPMLTALRRCLAMPNGADLSELTEPLYLPYQTDPRFRALQAQYSSLISPAMRAPIP